MAEFRVPDRTRRDAGFKDRVIKALEKYGGIPEDVDEQELQKAIKIMGGAILWFEEQGHPPFKPGDKGIFSMFQVQEKQEWYRRTQEEHAELEAVARKDALLDLRRAEQQLKRAKQKLECAKLEVDRAEMEVAKAERNIREIEEDQATYG